MPQTLPKLLIAGCGYVGLALSRSVSTKGWAVWGLRRTPEATGLLRAAGAEPLIADLTKPQTLRQLPTVDDVVSCQSPGRAGDYGATYLEGAQNLVSALATQSPKWLLWISSTGVYGQSHDEWVDEATPPQPTTERGRMLLAAEALVLAAPCPSMILRLGGIYGPGRDRLDLLYRGDAAIQATGYINQIHVDDVVGIIECLLERGEPRQIYLGVDDAPALRAEFYPWLAEQAGIQLPRASQSRNTRSSGSKRCLNQRIKALGYSLKYPDYRTGFAAVLGATPQL